jgi:hypothetical protein
MKPEDIVAAANGIGAAWKGRMPGHVRKMSPMEFTTTTMNNRGQP